jgi:hypothetical protein
VLHAGSLETVVATNAQILDQAQLKELLGEAEMMHGQAVQSIRSQLLADKGISSYHVKQNREFTSDSPQGFCSDHAGVDLVPLLKVLFAHVAACCRALALSVHLRKGGRQASMQVL